MPNSRTHLGVDTARDQSWRERAVCRPGSGHDPEMWFPPPPLPFGTRAQQRAERNRRLTMETEAIRLCHTCTVRSECLQYAVDNDEREGIWGALTPQQRGKQPLR